jgi:hypothetical protein
MDVDRRAVIRCRQSLFHLPDNLLKIQVHTPLLLKEKESWIAHTAQKLFAFQQTTLTRKRKWSNRKWTISKTVYRYVSIVFFLWRCDPTRVMAPLLLRFLDHTRRCTTVGRTPLDEWSARRSDLYPTTLNSRQTSMPLVGFEPKNPSRRAAADVRLRPRGYWDRHTPIAVTKITVRLPHLACWNIQALSGLLSNISNTNIWHKWH